MLHVLSQAKFVQKQNCYLAMLSKSLSNRITALLHHIKLFGVHQSFVGFYKYVLNMNIAEVLITIIQVWNKLFFMFVSFSALHSLVRTPSKFSVDY